MANNPKSKTINILATIKPDSNFKFPMQPYLRSKEISTVEKQNLFQLRNFSYNVKSFRKTQYENDMICRICQVPNSIENEIHTFKQYEILIDPEQSDIKFDHVFGNLEQQEKSIKYFSRIITKRDKFLDILNRRL